MILPLDEVQRGWMGMVGSEGRGGGLQRGAPSEVKQCI